MKLLLLICCFAFLLQIYILAAILRLIYKYYLARVVFIFYNFIRLITSCKFLMLFSARALVLYLLYYNKGKQFYSVRP